MAVITPADSSIYFISSFRKDKIPQHSLKDASSHDYRHLLRRCDVIAGSEPEIALNVPAELDFAKVECCSETATHSGNPTILATPISAG